MFNVFFSTLIFLYIPVSRIRGFHIRGSFAKRNLANTFVCTIFTVYIILFTYHNSTKIFFQFYALFRGFYIFFLIRWYILQQFDFTGGIEGKIRGKTKRRCRSDGNVEVGRGVKGPTGGKGSEERAEGRDNGTERRGREQRVLIDTAVLILGNSFYFIRFFFHLLRERGPREPAPPVVPVR